MNKAKQIVGIAQQIARETQGFHNVKGAGTGDKATHAFMAELQRRVQKALGRNYSEKQICGEIKSAVDFYIPEEKTIVEVALSLKTPLSEFYKDLFKALLAKDNGVSVKQLLFITKPGAIKRHKEPASQAIIRWLKKYYGVHVTIEELR